MYLYLERSAIIFRSSAPNSILYIVIILLIRGSSNKLNAREACITILCEGITQLSRRGEAMLGEAMLGEAMLNNGAYDAIVGWLQCNLIDRVKIYLP